MEKVSIIIPLYNKEDTICATVKSCLNQDYANIEVIVINDGSTDLSIEKVNTFTDKRLIVKSFPNAGVSSARNRGAKIATGDYLIFIDGDDLMMHDCVSSLLAMTKKYPNRDIYCGNCEISANGISYQYCNNSVEGLIKHNFRDRYLKKFTMSAGSTMYSKKSFAVHGGYDIRMSIFEDTDFDLRYLRFAKIAYTPKCLYRHVLDNAELSVKIKPLKCYYAYYADFREATCFWEKLIMAMIIYAIMCKFKETGRDEEYVFLNRKFKKYRGYILLHKIINKFVS